MLYTHKNAGGATVYDVDTKEKLDEVVEVNTRAGWVRVMRAPALADPRGN